MGKRGPGLARTQALLENLKREINLGTTTTLKNMKLTASELATGAARATITVADYDDIVNDETITLVDAEGFSNVFTFKTGDDVVTGNLIGIASDSSNANTATSIAAAINDASASTQIEPTITATASGVTVLLEQGQRGAAGNQTNDASGVTDVSVTNFTGGEGYGPGFYNSSYGSVEPSAYIQTIGGQIITTIEIDLTGLKSNTTADRLIGRDGTKGAYMWEYLESESGVVYKIEMSCLELPTASSNVGLDIDLYSSTDAEAEYDDTAGTKKVNAGTWAKGTTVVQLTPALTDKDFLVLYNGATHTAASIYTGGKYVIKLFGHADF
tara:strand:+ start:1733 stop:2713 length:981 start_codon:yes stop_codon:yes gene_type:complete